MSNEHHDPRACVVVGVDGSPECEVAIRYAVGETRRHNATLRLVHVMPAAPGGLTISILDATMSTPTGRALIERMSQIARDEDAEVPIETQLLAGDRLDMIVQAGRDADEIVLGHDPRASLLRLATGSTVIGVAAHARCPVVAVAPGHVAAGHGTIVVAIKHPRNARALLHRGFEVAGDRGVAVRFLHAWEFPVGYESLAPTKEERERLSGSAALEIGLPLAQLAKAHPDVSYEVTVTHGNPARVLEEASRTADLLVLARRAHAFPRGYIGGVARALLHHAACPVMFVPPGLAAMQEEPADAEVEDRDLPRAGAEAHAAGEHGPGSRPVGV